MPMPLTDIVRLHNRDLEGGGGGAGSASGTDFLQWPMDLRTPPVSFTERALTSHALGNPRVLLIVRWSLN